MPIARSECSTATPNTSPGSISGDTRNTEIASRPGKRPNTRPTAPSTPSTMAIADDASANPSELRKASQNGSSPQTLRYQRSENSLLGRSNTKEGENDTSST